MTTETHTYEDGTQRVGCPPFPELSPKQEQEAALRGEPALVVDDEAADPQPARRGRKPKAQD